MAAFVAVDAGEALVEIAAIQIPLDHLLLDRSPKAACGTQFVNVPEDALVQSGAAWIARAIGTTGRRTIDASAHRVAPPRIDSRGSSTHTDGNSTDSTRRSHLSSNALRVLGLPDVRERLLSQGMEPVSNTPEQFATYINSEISQWAKVVKASGARPE